MGQQAGGGVARRPPRPDHFCRRKRSGTEEKAFCRGAVLLRPSKYAAVERRSKSAPLQTSSPWICVVGRPSGTRIRSKSRRLARKPPYLGLLRQTLCGRADDPLYV